MSKNLELQNCLLVNFRNFISIQLDDSNYVTWKFLVETVLKGCGLIKYVDGSFSCPLEYKTLEENGVASEIEHEYMSWVQNDSAVMSILVATLSSNALSFIVGSKTSKEIWCRLKEKYVDTSRYNIMKLKSSLYNIQKGSDCIEKYLLRVKEICDQLAVFEVSIDEEEIIESVLHGLPSEFAVIKAIIRIKTMNSSVSMTKRRSLLLIAEDEIDQSVKSIFEKLKTELMEHGHSLNKFAPATTPTHVTNAKYDGAIPYNGAFSYGLPALYFMSTSSSCISAPLNTSEYAQQPPLPQFAAFSSQAFDCKSHFEDLKLVHKANNEKYEAIIDDAKREIHLLTSTVEEFKTELQNAKADWERKELQLVDFVKHSEEDSSSLKEEINRLLNLQKSIEKEACAMKEEEVQLKDSMKEIKSEVVYLQKALVDVKAENMKLRESILDKKNGFQSVMHKNEELQNRETVYHKKLEELSKLLEEVMSKKQAEENVKLTDGENAYDLLPKIVQFSEDSGHGREEEHKVEFPPTQCAEPQSENIWRWTNVSNGKAKHVDSSPIDTHIGKSRGIVTMWNVSCHQEGYSYQFANMAVIWVIGALLGVLFNQGKYTILGAETLMKTVGDAFKKGMYELQLQFRSIPQLESNPKYQKQKMTTNEACGLKMDSFPQVNVTYLVSIIHSNFDKGFPMVDHPSNGETLIIGRMLRIHLLILLQNFKLKLLCCSTFFICCKLMIGSLPSA